MRRTLAAYLLLIGAASAALAAEPSVSPDSIRRMQLNKTTNYVLIDLRPAKAFNQGRIQGAQNVPLSSLEEWQPPKDKEIVLYCPDAACPAADAAKKSLLDRGYGNTAVLQGGMAEWKEQGYPIAAGKPEQAARKPRVMRLSPKQAQTRIEAGQLFVLDVRPAPQFKTGRLPGAINVPLEQLASSLARIPEDAEILVYDRSSKRSREAAWLLLEAGRNVRELTGGIGYWARKRYPMEVK